MPTKTTPSDIRSHHGSVADHRDHAASSAKPATATGLAAGLIESTPIPIVLVLIPLQLDPKRINSLLPVASRRGREGRGCSCFTRISVARTIRLRLVALRLCRSPFG